MLKIEADGFEKIARTGRRGPLVQRAFDRLASQHRSTRMEINPVLRDTGTAMYMRQAAQTLRELGQILQRGPIGPGPRPFPRDDFDFDVFPRH